MTSVNDNDSNHPAYPHRIGVEERRLARKQILPSAGSGFVFDESTRVLRIRHVAGRDIDTQGSGGSAPSQYVTFDDPHLGAGTALERAYPSGVIDWSQGEWKIGVAEGKFGTFNLIPASLKSGQLGLSFHAPRVFAGIDAYNGGSSEANVTIRSGAPPVASTLRAPPVRHGGQSQT